MADRLPSSSEGEGVRRDDQPTGPPSISPSTDLIQVEGVLARGQARRWARRRGRGKGKTARSPETVSPSSLRGAAYQTSQFTDAPTSTLIDPPATSPPTNPPPTDALAHSHPNESPSIIPPSNPTAHSPPTDPAASYSTELFPLSYSTDPSHSSQTSHSPSSLQTNSSSPTDHATPSLPTDWLPPSLSTQTLPSSHPIGPRPSSHPTDPPPLSVPTWTDHPFPSLQSTRPRVLKESDLSALMTVLGDSAHCAFQLGIQMGVPLELVRMLEQQALKDPVKFLSLVLRERMKNTSTPLTLKTLVGALSDSSIHNQTLALKLPWKLQQHFDSVSYAGPEQPLKNQRGVPLSPAMAAYSQFLDHFYRVAIIPPYTKGGPEPSTMCTNLAVINGLSQTKTNAFTEADLYGGIDELIFCKRKAIELKDIFKPEEGQAKVDFVLAEGAPGVGKSTMALELCRRRHEIEATKAFAAVVLLRLREKEVQEAKSVADLFYHDGPDIQQAVVKEICSTSGENILFILDGFHEVPHKIRKSMFVAQIISGQCLPKATVLVTSRLSGRADLLSLRVPDKHIEVLGFTHELIEQYASSVFGSSTPLLADFLKYVSTNPAIKAMMYTPLNCVIVVDIYQENRKEGRPIPQTITELYSELTFTLMKRHHSDTGGLLKSFPTKLEALAVEHPESHDQLLILAKLAFNGTLKQEVIFEKLPACCSMLGLMTISQQLYMSSRGSTNYSFFHLSLQEFLSAYYISQLPCSEQQKAFEECSDEQHSKEKKFLHMDVVWRFVAGLTGFGSIGWDLVRSRKGNARYDSGVSSFFIECLYEAQQKVQCEAILGHRSEVHFKSGSAFASFAGGYCVAVSRSTWNVEFLFPPEALGMFVYGLTSQEEVHGSIVGLYLYQNPVGQEGIARLKDIPREALQQLSVLEVVECELDGSALDQLSDVIPSVTSLEYLNIGSNPAAGDGGTVKLLQTLQKAAASHLHTLVMEAIPIGRNDIMALSHLISPSGALKELVIGDHDMQCDCVELLLKVVLSPSSLQSLYLFNMRIDTTLLSFTPLKENHNITKLQIERGTIGSRNISCIAEVLCTNTTLEILRIGALSSVTIKSDLTGAFGDLADSVKVNRSLKELCLWLERPDESLALGREEARALIDALPYNQTLEELTLCWCPAEYFSEDEYGDMDSRVKFY